MRVFSDSPHYKGTYLGEVVDPLTWAVLQAHHFTTIACIMGEHSDCGGFIAPKVYANTHPCQCPHHDNTNRPRSAVPPTIGAKAPIRCIFCGDDVGPFLVTKKGVAYCEGCADRINRSDDAQD